MNKGWFTGEPNIEVGLNSVTTYFKTGIKISLLLKTSIATEQLPALPIIDLNRLFCKLVYTVLVLFGARSTVARRKQRCIHRTYTSRDKRQIDVLFIACVLS